LSQQNWIKERDELISREAYTREEFENARQAMQDWEVLAMNERSLRENLTEKDAELREQLESMRDEYEKAARDRDTNNQAVEGLQKALQEIQNRRFCTSKRTLAWLIYCSTKSRAQKVRRSLRIADKRFEETCPSRRVDVHIRKVHARVDTERVRASPAL
jgi:beta-phosphoglucomutase-like phosphatase (HAD superfamily)